MTGQSTSERKTMKVAKVVDEYTIVINSGSSDGIKPGQRFLIYAIGEEICDPDTKENLGQLEIVRGTGKVVHLQEKIATVTSDMRNPPKRTVRKVKRPSGALGLAALYSTIYGYGTEEVEEEQLPADTVPFESASVGDLVKPI